MRINWVFADGYKLNPLTEIEKIKNIGATWGSWTTWHTCRTDNVICHSLPKAQELVSYGLHSQCNFYVPQQHYEQLGNPPRVSQYQGNFEHDVDHAEDIVALHFVSAVSDLVLLVGFDFGKIVTPIDKSAQTSVLNYHGLVRAVIDNSSTEWVAIDHSPDLGPIYQGIPNITCDTMKNVLQLFV